MQTFVIGSIVNIDHFVFEVNDVDGNKVEFSAGSFWSANAVKGYDYTYEDGVLEISIIEVDLASYLYPSGSIEPVMP